MGIEEAGASPKCEPLIEQFLEGLTNRNADDDRSRARRHLLPRFGPMRPPDVTLAKVMEKTEAFLKFNDFAIVCVDCYARFKTLHSAPN